MNAAAKRGARYGAAQEATTAQTQDLTQQVLGAGFNNALATVLIKDASVFDDPANDPKSINYSSLPNATLENLDTRDLFLVRVSVPYDSVALLPPFWIKSFTLTTQSVMRRE